MALPRQCRSAIYAALGKNKIQFGVVMKNIEMFESVTALVFADLYETFPVPMELSKERYGARLSEAGLVDEGDFSSGWGMPDFVEATLLWLNNCDYIFLEKQDATLSDTTYRATLAPKAFESMRQKSPLDEKETLGESFRRMVADKSWKGLGIMVSTALSTSVGNALAVTG